MLFFKNVHSLSKSFYKYYMYRSVTKCVFQVHNFDYEQQFLYKDYFFNINKSFALHEEILVVYIICSVSGIDEISYLSQEFLGDPIWAYYYLIL